MAALAVMRHGITEANMAKRLLGRADEPLSEEGRRLVLRYRLPPELSGFAPLSSPLIRARETAALLGLAAAIEPALIEMDWGAWQGRTIGELRQEYGEAFADEERRGLDLTPPGGESPREVQARLMPWLESLRGPTLAITHKGVMRALYALATGWTMREREPDTLERHAVHLFCVGVGGCLTVERLNLALLG